MRASRRSAAAAFATVALVSTWLWVASPAYAAPWDGDPIEYESGEWYGSFWDFKFSDIRLVFPDTSSVNTDIWDDAGVTRISSAELGLDRDVPRCATADVVDVQNPEPATGDLVLTCENDNPLIVSAGLDVTLEMRVLEGGEVVRFMTSITNTTDATVTIDGVSHWVNFGGEELLWDYDNQSDAILAVPASDSPDLSAQLNEVGARWIVHWHSSDAPGGFIVGNDTAEVTGEWLSAQGDLYDYRSGSFEIPAGETRSVVVFATWTPDELIAGEFTGAAGNEEVLTASANALVEDALALQALTGDVAHGIADVSEVVNWGPGPVVEPEPEPGAEEPELADTGAGDVAGVALVALLVLMGGTALVMRRRVRA